VRLELVLMGCVAVSLPSALAAQEVVWRRTGEAGRSLLGGSVAVIGDTNRDGIQDIAAVTNAYGVDLWILSGRDGATLRTKPQYGPRHGHQTVVQAGDVDGDGIGDYAVTLVDTTGFDIARVQICSGADDHEIAQVNDWAPFQWNGFGSALVGDLDLDGDARPDLLVCARYHRPSGGAVHAYTHDGRHLYTLLPTTQTWIGLCAAKVGDVDRDGCDDFVVGAGHADTLGRALLYSGRTGTLLVEGRGELPDDNLGGEAVTGCGDLDGDGIPDFAASGMPFLGTGRLVVRAFSGSSGQPLYTWIGKGALTLGGGIDFDQDGLPDVISGAPYSAPNLPGRPGRIYAFSGRDGSQIHEQLPSTDGTGNATLIGYHLAMMPAQPGNPYPGYIAAEPGITQGQTALGRVLYVRASPPTVSGYGNAARGTLASTPLIGLRDLGPQGIRIHLSGAEAGAPALLLLGLSRTRLGSTALPLDLSPLGFLGCRLLTSADVPFPVTAGRTGVAAGYALVDLALPLDTSTVGSLTLFGQWLCLGTPGTWPGGVSAALSWTHAPRGGG
jgi:hypothetical protein